MSGIRRHPAREPLSRLDWILPVAIALGVYWFGSSFLFAKRSLTDASRCDDPLGLLTSALGLSKEEAEQTIGPDAKGEWKDGGCWNSRRIDSLTVLVVDALRFDFALYELPLSVGARLSTNSAHSRLLQFVADPPTVTMQRVKGLTTGGLPTFADVSGSFGGAQIDEDSWVQQLASHGAQMAFVGDDTWVDLFPTQFQTSYPFPSFNTRDLDTVDNGCLDKLPGLLQRIPANGKRESDSLDVVLAHFLGVDHVGHTYGPHNQHMTQKLHQMDVALDEALTTVDDKGEKGCHLALVFGDHGMTESGNHGGGAYEETHAALFVHYSPGCKSNDLSTMYSDAGDEVRSAVFEEIYQIDLVPTISLLMGIPIPYANIGGVVPHLLMMMSPREIATSLALNAAQVWQYLYVYSTTANALPGLSELDDRRKEAVEAYKQALQEERETSQGEDKQGSPTQSLDKASRLLKLFLVEASELGHRVWTRFNTTGMIIGGVVVGICTIISGVLNVLRSPVADMNYSWHYTLETGLTVLFIVFHCIMLTFSNSYIDAEQKICMFMLAILSVSIYVRLQNNKLKDEMEKNDHTYRRKSRLLKVANFLESSPSAILLLPVFSRLQELFISGHGMDSSIPGHFAHHSAVFLSSSVLLIIARILVSRFVESKHSASRRLRLVNVLADVSILCCMIVSWWEKRRGRHGFVPCRIAIALLLLSLPAVRTGVAVIIKLLIAIMIVTGPSAASSTVLQSVQIFIFLDTTRGRRAIPAPASAAILRFLIRHAFFASNHACAFNRLQYSAAFVSTAEFQFAFAGTQLFLNTFGHHILGLVVAAAARRGDVWRWYCWYQLLETFASCLSVSVLRRHLMVWAVFAPRFTFSCIFLLLACGGEIVTGCLQREAPGKPQRRGYAGHKN